MSSLVNVEIVFMSDDGEPLMSVDWTMFPPVVGETIVLDEETVRRFDLPTNAYRVRSAPMRKLGYARPPLDPLRYLADAIEPIVEVVV